MPLSYSFVVAQRLGTSPQPVLAPLTALLVVQLTMYETLTSGLQRVASVVAAVLIAVGVATYVGLTWWSLGAVGAASLVIGRRLRLGPQLLEVPISAMLVLAVGGAQGAALDRIYETLIGAAVGVTVNVVIAAPLYVQPASDAIGELADRMATFLRRLADQLGAGWSRESADRMLNEARRLGDEVDHADWTLARAQDSARFNPRVAQAREAPLRTALTGLEHTHLTIRNLCRSLLDRTYFVPSEQAETAYDAQVRGVLAQVLDAAADAIGRPIRTRLLVQELDRAPGCCDPGRDRDHERQVGRLHQFGLPGRCVVCVPGSYEQAHHQRQENQREQALDDVPSADRRAGEDLSGPQRDSHDVDELEHHGKGNGQWQVCPPGQLRGFQRRCAARAEGGQDQPWCVLVVHR